MKRLYFAKSGFRSLAFICAVIVTAISSTSTAYAHEVDIHLHAADSVCADEYWVVSVEITEATAVKSVAVVPEYDDTLFELVGGEWSLEGTLADFSIEKGDGVIAFSEAQDIDGDVLRFTLKPTASSAGKTAAVSCEAVIIDEHSHKTECRVEAITVEIQCHHTLNEENTKCIKCGASVTEAEEELHTHNSAESDSHTVGTTDSTPQSKTEESAVVNGESESKNRGTLLLIGFCGGLLGCSAVFIYKKRKALHKKS